MVFPNEKETIIKYLGKHFSRKIIPYLNSKKCLNQKGSPYSPKSIQNIVNGETDNPIVEEKIFELVATEKKKAEKLINLKKTVI